MRILFISGWFPHPTDNGSRLRIFNLLKGIATRHRVSLLTFSDRPVSAESMTVLQELCDSVEVVPWREFQPNSARALFALLSPTPRSFVDTFSSRMAQAIRAHLRCGFDVVVASELTMLAYADLLQDVPTILEDVELEKIYDQFAGASSPRQRARLRLTWWKTRQYVGSRVRRFRACTVASVRGRDILCRAAPGYKPIYVIPNGVVGALYAGIAVERPPDSLVFTGSLTFSANLDAVQYFLAEVFPLVRNAVPDAQITITGRAPDGPLMPALSSPGVNYLGYVADVRPVVGTSVISVAPIRSGGGTRLKVLEAMALGTPVVSTTKGAEGLDAVDGEHLLIGDTPELFAAQVVRLLRDEALRQRLATNARQLVKVKYDWSVIMPRFLDLLEHVARC